MPLEIGTTLGVYEVTAAIGAGGMGEVYKARDTKLDRDVALKILPDAFASDPERLARFQREAKVLASLNHPNIAAIYGLEEAGESPALVLEYVEGPTLQELIGRAVKNAPMPLDEALPIARQIAEALEAAHEQGIIHRDLKPANVKVKSDGTVKVLDFGLAKALGPELSDTEAANSPTMTMTAAATKMGVIMGTAAYMSPEQARGKQVDKRADIWAFGVVLYEMLTGTHVFAGEDVSLTLSQVLQSHPDWSALPEGIPSGVDSYLRRCLEKDPRQRIRDIGDVRLALDGAFDRVVSASDEVVVTSITPTALWQRPAGVAAIALVTAALTVLTVWLVTPEPVRPVSRAVVSTAPDGEFFGTEPQHQVAISPDGSRIVYTAGAGIGRELFVRPVASLEGTRGLGGIDGADTPFFSPDGAWVGFASQRETSWKKVSILGGPFVTLWDSPSAPRGASWGPDDTIIFAQSAAGAGLFRGPAAGGEPEILTTPDEASGEVNHAWPEFLPGGRAVLFTVLGGTAAQDRTVAVLDLDTNERRTLVPGGSNPRYAPTGHILYGAGGVLFAVPFDLDRLEVTGDPVPLLEDVMMSANGAVNFALSANGSLAYATGTGAGVGGERTLVWVDRAGMEEPVGAEPRRYQEFALSPDGTRVAAQVGASDGQDVWIYDLARNTFSRLTFGAGNEEFPTWTPDGTRVAFGPPVSWKAADGTGEVETLGGDGSWSPQAFTPDGRTVIVRQNTGGKRELGVLTLDDGHVERLMESEFSQRNAALSPDGRWLAYQSNESGQTEVYVRPFPDVDSGPVAGIERLRILAAVEPSVGRTLLHGTG